MERKIKEKQRQTIEKERNITLKWPPWVPNSVPREARSLGFPIG
jgi:hypothetical protein